MEEVKETPENDEAKDTPEMEEADKNEMEGDGLTTLDSTVDEVKVPKPKRSMMDHLFDFIRVEEELNPVLCGYFSKFLGTLMFHSRKQFQTYIYNPKNQVIEYMTKHIYNRSIADCLVKILLQDILMSDF